MNALLKQTLAGLRVLLVFTVLLGVVYPLGVWAVSRIPGLEGNAEGSIIGQDGQAAGSSLIGVDPVAADPAKDPWFHNRPSAGSKDALGPGDPSSSGASNKGPYDEGLIAAIGERKKLIAAREGVQESRVPADAVTASSSGMDPAISVAYAELQIPRVARNTGLPEEKVRQLVAENTGGAGIGVPGVNVLKVNLAVRDAAGGAH
ncbi:potassium-transporting ATPase subunit C [Amycolatopsis decaplanina]|uniref:Potassium-transporting ATPase KdpC subunit n=1 Tax=Amycolatopsis decaplanina DSM 44594 TaxID=1284240 RepID=M2ZBR4_9PSEU|nr:potassium-transporting ATPase subunit C [Amycolatopsis decaplanina]EME58363.1 K+-transporting ATPase ATPase C chain [Amycolatopsis decaplanina DSM 44594]